MWCWRHRHPPPARRVLAPTVDKPLGPAREEVGWADGTLRRDHGSVVIQASRPTFGGSWNSVTKRSAT